MSHRVCWSTGKQFADLLKIFRRHEWEDLHLPEDLRTARAWQLALRREIPEYEDFEHIDIAAACGIEDECLILSVRRDLEKTLLRMIEEGPGSLHFWASKKFSEDDERLFDNLWNGDRWNDLQVRCIFQREISL